MAGRVERSRLELVSKQLAIGRECHHWQLIVKLLGIMVKDHLVCMNRSYLCSLLKEKYIHLWLISV